MSTGYVGPGIALIVLALFPHWTSAQIQRYVLHLDNASAITAEADPQYAKVSPLSADPSGSRGGNEKRAVLAVPRIQYEGGDLGERSAAIVDDPAGASGKVLEFRISSPNVRDSKGRITKSRVQMNFYGNKNLKEFRQSVRLFLAPDFEAVRNFDWAFNWLTISEWWNNAPWGDAKFPFRISVAIQKLGAERGRDLTFGAGAQTFDPRTGQWSVPLWEAKATDFGVPVGKWMTLNYYFREGNSIDGRFVLTVAVDGGRPVRLVDIRNWTHHPDDPAPDGLAHFNPVKLYTSARLVDALKAEHKALVLYWSDLELAVCERPTVQPQPSCPELSPP